MAGLQLRKGCVGTGNQDRKDTSPPPQASRSKRGSLEPGFIQRHRALPLLLIKGLIHQITTSPLWREKKGNV